MRERLEDTRPGATLNFDIFHVEGVGEEARETVVGGYLTTGLYPDGRLGEIFVRVGKVGTSEAVYDQWAIAFSMALQHGASVDALCDKFIGSHFAPAGRTSVEGLPKCTSLFDLVCRWAKFHYGRRVAPSAMIVRKGRVLLAKRHEGTSQGGLWETPGGKAELGELPEEALAREIREELGVSAQIGSIVTEEIFDPPELPRAYRMPLYEVRIDGEPQPLASSELKWCGIDEAAALGVDGKLTLATGRFVKSIVELAEHRAASPKPSDRFSTLAGMWAESLSRRITQ